MNYHFIAIGGAAMHNIAIALKNKGHCITGSDDEIFEPSKSRLQKYNLLPAKPGWFPERINKNMDAIILGMHALENNPELIKALELGIKVYSFPEFFYEQTRNKKRIVIAGSHGKTTVTSMIMHVLKGNQIKIDYLVGSQIEGFETMSDFDKDSEIAIIEGDEYFASPLDKRPKFVLYKPNIVLITGIAWDHFNVYPTFGDYKKPFQNLIYSLNSNNTIVFDAQDEYLKNIVQNINIKSKIIPYSEHNYILRNEQVFLLHGKGMETKINLFGRHNMKNIAGAKIICNLLNVNDENFYNSIASFKGAAKRLQILQKKEKDSFTAYIDFAHSPSKLKATINAVREKHPYQKIIAFFELHTYSSLNKSFIPNYFNTLKESDLAVVFYNPNVVKHKGLEDLDKKYIEKSFGGNNLKVIDSIDDFISEIKTNISFNTTFLFMSSGNFSGIDLNLVLENHNIK